MGRKRKPSAHQRQILFFTVFLTSVIAVAMALLFWFVNRSPVALP